MTRLYGPQYWTDSKGRALPNVGPLTVRDTRVRQYLIGVTNTQYSCNSGLKPLDRPSRISYTKNKQNQRAGGSGLAIGLAHKARHTNNRRNGGTHARATDSRRRTHGGRIRASHQQPPLI